MRTLLAADVASTHDFSNNYTYDNLHRLTKLTQAGVSGGNAVAEKRVDFGYNAAGQSTSINRYSDVAGSSLVASSAYSYDLAGRLTGLTHSNSSSTALAGYGWTFDDANRVTGFNNSAHPGENAAYTYDPTNQLLDSTRSGGTESQTYDANGNRTDGSFTSGADNRLTSDGTYTYLYDGEGNRTAKFIDTNSNGLVDSGDTTISTYTWDHRDRLTDVSHVASFGGSVDVDVQYSYDMYNRLIDRAVTGSSVTVEQEQFAYDGIESVLTFNGSSTSNLATRTLFGPAVDQILATEDVTSLSTAGTRSWKLTDQQNTVRDIVADNGSILVHQNFDSWGKLLSTPPTSTFFVGYTGEYFDILVGLQFNLNRWYDNSTHGWISHDPIEADANSYRYVGCDPLEYSDPFGFEKWSGDSTIEATDPSRLGSLQFAAEIHPQFYDQKVVGQSTYTVKRSIHQAYIWQASEKTVSVTEFSWDDWATSGWVKIAGVTRHNHKHMRITPGIRNCCNDIDYDEQQYVRDIARRHHNIYIESSDVIEKSVASNISTISNYVPSHPLVSASLATAAMVWGDDIKNEVRVLPTDEKWVLAATDTMWKPVEGSVKQKNVDCDANDSPRNVGEARMDKNPLGTFVIREIGKRTEIAYNTEAERSKAYKENGVPEYD